MTPKHPNLVSDIGNYVNCVYHDEYDENCECDGNNNDEDEVLAKHGDDSGIAIEHENDDKGNDACVHSSQNDNLESDSDSEDYMDCQDQPNDTCSDLENSDNGLTDRENLALQRAESGHCVYRPLYGGLSCLKVNMQTEYEVFVCTSCKDCLKSVGLKDKPLVTI